MKKLLLFCLLIGSFVIASTNKKICNPSRSFLVKRPEDLACFNLKQACQKTKQICQIAQNNNCSSGNCYFATTAIACCFCPQPVSVATITVLAHAYCCECSYEYLKK